MDLFTYLMAKKGHNTHRDLFSYLLGKGTGGGGTYTTFSGISLNISNTLQAKIKNIALEGNTSQDGDPTPDTPIPIKVVTGEQNVEIRGKNLFDKDNANIINGYIQTGNTTLLSNGSTNKLIWINIKSSTTYTISKKVFSSSKNRFGIATSVEEPATGISISNAIQQNNNNYLTVTSGQNDNYLIVYPWTDNDTYTLEDVLDTIQIEEGTTATEYEPYYTPQTYPLSLGNIELAKIGDYKDYIFKNEIGSPYYNADLELDSWYEYNGIYKYVVTGNETFNNRFGVNLFAMHNAFEQVPFVTGYGLSNYYKYNSIQSGINGNTSNGDFVLQYDRGNCSLFLKNTSFDNVTDFTTNLKEKYNNGNPVIIMFPLKTPTNTKITDTTLIQQLENLNNNARSYKGTTIIECTSESADNETIGFSGDIKVTSLGNSLNTSLLSSNIQEETNLDDVNEIEEQNDEPVEEEVS